MAAALGACQDGYRMGFEIGVLQYLRRSLEAAPVAAELDGLVLYYEFGALEDGTAGDDLVREAHLLLAEVGQVSDDGGHAVDLGDVVLLELEEDAPDQVGHDGYFVHRPQYARARLKGCMRRRSPCSSEKCLQNRETLHFSHFM